MIIPVFETECAMYPGHPEIPPPSEKFTITPFERRSHGAAACAKKNGPFTFVSSDASQISSVVETTLDGKKFAAQFTTTSIRPNSCDTRCTRPRICSTLVNSACIAAARRPTLQLPHPPPLPPPPAFPKQPPTSAPSLGSRIATTRPSRFPAPVTSATRPLNLVSIASSYHTPPTHFIISIRFRRLHEPRSASHRRPSRRRRTHLRWHHAQNGTSWLQNRHPRPHRRRNGHSWQSRNPRQGSCPRCQNPQSKISQYPRRSRLLRSS